MTQSRLDHNIAEKISEFLSLNDITTASQVATQWNQFFINQEAIWKHQLEQNFGIKKDSLLFIEKNFGINSYKQLYKQLKQLNKRLNKRSINKNPHLTDISYLLQNKDKNKQCFLIICCLDHFDLTDRALSLIPKEEYALWFKFCIHMGFDTMAKAIYESIKFDLYQMDRMYYLNQTVLAGNSEFAIKQLNETLYDIKLTPTAETLNNAFLSKNEKLIRYLINSGNPFKIEITNQNLIDAACWGGVIFDQLRKKMGNIPFSDVRALLSGIITNATKHGHLDIVKTLIPIMMREENKIFLNDFLLHFAFNSGNRQLIDYFLFILPHFPSSYSNHMVLSKESEDLVLEYLKSGKLQLNSKMLLFPARNGNIQLFKQFIELGMKPDDDVLSAAASSGNLELVKYLLNSFQLKGHGFELAKSAIHSRNARLVDFLHEKSLINSICISTIDISFALSTGSIELVNSILKVKPFAFGENAWITSCIQDYQANSMLDDTSSVELIEYLIKISPWPLEGGTYLLEKAAKTGSKELVSYLIEKFPSRVVTQEVLEFATKTGSEELVNYLIEKFPSLVISQKALLNAIDSKNLALIYYLLDPAIKGYELHIELDKLNLENYLTHKNLLICDVSFKQAIQEIKALRDTGISNPDAIQDLEKAYRSMPSHFFRLSKHILLNLAINNLSLLEKITAHIAFTLTKFREDQIDFIQWRDLFREIGEALKQKQQYDKALPYFKNAEDIDDYLKNLPNNSDEKMVNNTKMRKQ